MEDKDYIEQLFSSKLKDAEMPVNPEIWSKVSAGISSAVAGTGIAGGTSFLSGKIAWIAATVVSVLGIGTAIYLSQPDDEPVKPRVVQSHVNQTIVNDEVKNEIVSENVKDAYSNNEEQESVVEDVMVEQEPDAETAPSETSVNIPQDILVEEEVGLLPARTTGEVENHVVGVKPETKPTSEKSNIEENTVEEDETFIVGKEVEKEEIRLPNAFSPNQDGNEDLFYINELPDMSDFQVVVLNNKSQVVYQSNDVNFKWDGMGLSGEKVEAGTYLYFLTGIKSDGTKFNKASRLVVYH